LNTLSRGFSRDPTVRRLPARLEAAQPALEPTGGSAPTALSSTAVHRTGTTPLTPERYKIQVTVDRATYELLRRAQDLMRHRLPGGDPAIIFARALALLAEDLEGTKFAKTAASRAPRRMNATSRHIPASVERLSGSATAAAARSKEPKADASRKVFWNFTT
jgi:hypothetical protein